MSLLTLRSFFRPRSLAVVGASRAPDSLGTVVLRNLLRAEFEGPILPITPSHDSVLGVLCHRSVDHLPLVPELAILCTPPPTLPGLIRSLGREGTRAVIVMSAARDAAESADLRTALLQAARPHGVRVLGPGSNGVQVPSAHLDASWMVTRARPGAVALVSQSGSLIGGMLRWADAHAIGFSHVVSAGEAADVDLGDLLDCLATDPDVRAVLLYLHALEDSRKFLSAARAIARIKPVIAIKPGRDTSDPSIVFPTGQVLPGIEGDRVYDVALRRAGTLRVRDIDELFDAAETLSHGRRVRGDRLAIVSNGAGPAEMALAALLEGGGAIAQLSPETAAALAKLLGRRQGPAIDLGREATPRRYRDVVAHVLSDPGVDAALVMHAPTPLAGDEACAAELVEAARGAQAPLLACWLGIEGEGPAWQRLNEAGIANYLTPEKATRAFLHLVRYRRNQDLLRQTPSTPAPDKANAPLRARARDIVAGALGAGRMWLHEEEASQLLECYGIRAQPARLAADARQAVQLASELGFPVTLQRSMRAPGRELGSEAEVRDAAVAAFADPGAALPGMPGPRVVVRPVPRKPDALTLMAGIATDPVFGRVLHVGPGGLQKRIDESGALSLPPLNMVLAEEMVARTRIGDLISQTFNRSGLDPLCLASLLVRLSELAVDLPEVTLLQINPLLADRDGVLGCQVACAIERPRPGRPTLAIRPYPSELEEELPLKGGRKVLARPVRPDDEPAYLRLLNAITPEDLYSRFCKAGPVPREVAASLIHIDYDREMSFVALDGGEILGAVDAIATTDNREAEYSILVRSDQKRTGLGRALMEKIIRYCKERGIREIYGMVLKTNDAMLGLDFRLGFQPDLDADHDDSMLRMALELR